MYSNVGGDLQNADTRGQTFMRGHQRTGSDGYVEFDTVVPGWELVTTPGPVPAVVRTTHIHLKIFHEHQITTTQLYFPDALIDQLYASVAPYRTHRRMTAPGSKHAFDRIRNGDDSVFIADHAAPLEVKREGDGLVALATIGLVSMGSRGASSLFR
jgi:protocatechuate 3,4-dioxygenase beta subunit